MLSKTIEQIKDKIELLKKYDSSHSVLGSKKHAYTFNPALSESVISAFEKKEQVSLPETYRNYLIHLGNGGVGPGYGVFTLENARNGAGYYTPIKNLNHRAADEQHPGELLIADYGCGLFAWLKLVGPNAGEIWFDGRVNDTQPYRISSDFLEWYKDWVDSLFLEEGFIFNLGEEALTLGQNGDFKEAIALFKLAVSIEYRQKYTVSSFTYGEYLKIFCNVLYFIQNDNTGLPIDKELNHFFLEKSLAHAKENPAIYFNAACVYNEMEAYDQVIECIKLAEMYYDDYDMMVQAIKTEAPFEFFRKESRYSDLFPSKKTEKVAPVAIDYSYYKYIPLEKLIEKKEKFIDIISRHYPLNETLLDQYQSKLNWNLVVDNSKISWTEGLIRKFLSQIGEGISSNTLPVSVALIKTCLKDEILDWEDLKWMKTTFESEELTALCLKEWGNTIYDNPDNMDEDELKYMLPLEYLGYSSDHKWPNAPWVYKVFEDNEEIVHWDILSGSEKFPWTVAFIKKHQDKWDWNRMLRNNTLPWGYDFFKELEHKINWEDQLFGYYDFPLDLKVIDAFGEKMNWRYFDMDDKRLDLEFFKRYAHKIHWITYNRQEHIGDDYFNVDACNHPAIKWTLDLYTELGNTIDQQYDTLNNNNYHKDMYWTCWLNTNNWTLPFFEMLLEKQKKENIQTIDWWAINASDSPIWRSPEFIKKYKALIFEKNPRLLSINMLKEDLDTHYHLLTDDSWYRLSSTTKLITNIDILKKYKRNWNWSAVSSFHPELNDKLIDKFEAFWDYKSMSGNENLSPEVIYHIKDKPLDWGLFSYQYSRVAIAVFLQVKGIKNEESNFLSDYLSLDQIVELSKKPWDWHRISWQHTELNLKTIINLKELWNYESLSQNGSLPFEAVLKLPEKPWNWFHLGRLKSLDLNKLNAGLPWRWSDFFEFQAKNIDLTNYINDELIEDFLNTL